MNQPDSAHSRRKKILINRPFQLKMIGYHILVALSTSLIFFAANKVFFWKFAAKGRAIGLPPSHVFFQFLESQDTFLSLIYLGTAIIVSIVLFVTGLYVSHRIAGPIYKTIQMMNNNFQSQDASHFKFRDNDYFPELEQAIIRLLEENKALLAKQKEFATEQVKTDQKKATHDNQMPLAS